MFNTFLAVLALVAIGCSSSSTNQTPSGGGTGGTAGAGFDASTGGVGGGSGSGSGGGGAPADGATNDGQDDAPNDAPDAPEPPCLEKGFSFSPTPPSAAGFKVTYGNATGFVCIGWNITCSNGSATTSPATPGNCSDNNCWAADVSGCAAGAVTITFLKDKANGLPPCEVGAGTEVATCNLTLGS